MYPFNSSAAMSCMYCMRFANQLFNFIAHKWHLSHGCLILTERRFHVAASHIDKFHAFRFIICHYLIMDRLATFCCIPLKPLELYIEQCLIVEICHRFFVSGSG